MAEFTPHFAPIVVLSFLGAIFLTGLSILVLLYGAARRSKLFAEVGGGAALIVAAGYSLVLGVASLASSERMRNRLPSRLLRRRLPHCRSSRPGSATNFCSRPIRPCPPESVVR